MDLKKLNKLRIHLEKHGKDTKVLCALSRVLERPDNMDLQIDLLGVAHKMHWLPNRKRALWDSLPIGGTDWIQSCVSGIFGDVSDLHPLCALLKCPVLGILMAAQHHCPSLATVWDVPGGETAGIGLVRNESGLEDYIYVGWRVRQTERLATRIDFIKNMRPTSEHPGKVALPLQGEFAVRQWSWAELPCRYAHRPSAVRRFGDDDGVYGGYVENTQVVLKELGFIREPGNQS